MNGERWLSVVGFESEYEISNLGRLKSLHRRVDLGNGGWRVFPERLMKLTPSGNGYLNIALRKSGDITYTTIHAIVLRAFVGDPQPGQEGRHLDGDRINCRLDNLEWGTRLENMRDQYRHGTRIAGEHHPRAVLTSELTRWVKQSTQRGVEIAHALEVSPQTISRARSGDLYAPAA